MSSDRIKNGWQKLRETIRESQIANRKYGYSLKRRKWRRTSWEKKVSTVDKQRALAKNVFWGIKQRLLLAPDEIVPIHTETALDKGLRIYSMRVDGSSVASYLTRARNEILMEKAWNVCQPSQFLKR